MDILFLGIVIFLFMLAVFDLSVGVSNDAVNFMTSAIGSKAASFKKSNDCGRHRRFHRRHNEQRNDGCGTTWNFQTGKPGRFTTL